MLQTFHWLHRLRGAALPVLSTAVGGATAAGSVVCTGELSGPLPTVVVPDGASCVLIDADVTGNVSAGEGTTVLIIRRNVSGNVSSVNGSFAAVLGSTAPETSSYVGGNVEFIGTGSGTGLAAYLCGTTVQRNVRLDGTTGAAVGGPLQSGAACRDANTAATTLRVWDNVAAFNVNCSDNGPDFNARGNTGRRLNEQCNIG